MADLRVTALPQAAEHVEQLYREHVEAARHLPVLALELGHPVACQRGCCDCCCELVAMTHAEAFVMAVFLAQPEQAELRERFVRRARDWMIMAGSRPKFALEALRSGDDTGYLLARREHGLKRIMCPANEDGDCKVYEQRPLACRMTYVVDTSANCAPRDPPGPEMDVISSEPYEQFLDHARQLVSDTEAALGHDARDRVALAPAVLDALRALGAI